MAVTNSSESPLFELRNFRLNESLFRERTVNPKPKPGHRGGSPGRMSPCSRRGMNCETQVKVVTSGGGSSGQCGAITGGGAALNSPGSMSPGIHHTDARSFSPSGSRSRANLRPRRSMTFDSHTKAATSRSRTSVSPKGRRQGINSSSRLDLHDVHLPSASSSLTPSPTLTAPAKLQTVGSHSPESSCRRDPTLHPSPERRRVFGAAGAFDHELARAAGENLMRDHHKKFKDSDLNSRNVQACANSGDSKPIQIKKELLSPSPARKNAAGGGGSGDSENDGGLSLDETTIRMLVKVVSQEVRGSPALPIQLDDFTGTKSPYLAEDAMVWLKKLRLASRQNEWTDAQTLEVASIHLRGLAARWFVSIEKHLREALESEKERWEYFQSQFEERFADYRSRLLQIEKIKGMRLRDGEDVREYAEAVMSMNRRLEDPLDDEFLGWVFVQGLPPSELRDKLYNVMETHSTLASAVQYARRFQLSQTVFSIKESIRRTSVTSPPPHLGDRPRGVTLSRYNQE